MNKVLLSIFLWSILLISIISSLYNPNLWIIPIAVLIFLVGLEKYLERNNEK